MIKRLVVLLSLSLLGAGVGAQEPGIHVRGFASVRVDPDIARFNFGIAGQTDSPADAMMRADTISSELVRRLERLGIASEDIQSTPVTLSPFQDRQTQRELIRFNRSTTAVLRDLDRFEDVNEAALESGVNSIGGVEFAVSNAEELQDGVRDMALADAREEAAAIAAGLGVRLGRVVSVSFFRQRPSPLIEARNLAALADAGGPEFRTGQVEITQEVSVSFEILP